MPQTETMHTDDAFNAIFDEMAEEERVAAAAEEAKEEEQEEKKAEEKEKPEEEESKEEESKEEEEDVTEEEEETSEEEEEVEEEEEEKSVQDVDKEESKEYNWSEHREKITVDGQESEVTLGEALENYQRKVASDKRFREAAEMKKETEVFWKRILAEPGEALVDRIVDEIAEGDRVKARAIVVQSLLEWMEPERQAYAIENEKEQELFLREHEMKLRQQEYDRQLTRREEERAIAETEEFTRDITKEITTGLKQCGLPIEKTAIWQRVGDHLKDFRAELPSYIQEDVAATRRELIKQARAMCERVAAEEKTAIEALPTLTDEELAKRNPQYAAFLKQQRIEKAREKRSTKKKGNVEKKKQETQEKKAEKKTKPSFVSTDELFRGLDED